MAKPTLFLPRCVPWVLIPLWVGGIAAGFLGLYRYASTPGAVGDQPWSWPVASTLPRPAGRPTLLLFAHPRCPCTRATISELALIMAHGQGQVKTEVLFYKPKGSSPAWEQTATWRAAEAIPGVQVAADLDGREAARFSAKTSGQALLYSPEGRLLFRGGITGSRGHAGDNPGREAILAFVTGGHPEVQETPVFGCPFSDDESDPR